MTNERAEEMAKRLPQGLTTEQVEACINAFCFYVEIAYPENPKMTPPQKFWQERLQLSHSNLMRRLLQGVAPSA